jgi:putative membrane protein
MKKTIKILFASLAVFALASCGNHNDSTEQAKDMNDKKDSSNAPAAMDKSDADFMVNAADGGMMEVELGNIAQERATDPMVKSFGAMMVRDHSKAGEELKNLAAQKNVSMPVTMGEEKQKMVNDMRGEKDFDKKYINMMVSDHKKDVDKFEDIAKNGKDADLRAWASTTVMTLRNHLDSAQYIDDRLKNKK